MAHQYFSRGWRRSGLQIAALALLTSFFAPVFCPIGLFAMEVGTPGSSEGSGCHDSKPVTPSSPAPHLQCCTVRPAQGQPAERYVVPAPATAILSVNDTALVPLAMSLFALPVAAPDSSPPGQSVLRI